MHCDQTACNPRSTTPKPRAVPGRHAPSPAMHHPGDDARNPNHPSPGTHPSPGRRESPPAVTSIPPRHSDHRPVTGHRSSVTVSNRKAPSQRNRQIAPPHPTAVDPRRSRCFYPCNATKMRQRPRLRAEGALLSVFVEEGGSSAYVASHGELVELVGFVVGERAEGELRTAWSSWATPGLPSRSSCWASLTAITDDTPRGSFSSKRNRSRWAMTAVVTRFRPGSGRFGGARRIGRRRRGPGSGGGIWSVVAFGVGSGSGHADGGRVWHRYDVTDLAKPCRVV